MEQFPALAGWRGLLDPAAVALFDYSLYVVSNEREEVVGWITNLVGNLGVNLSVVVYEDNDELTWLKSRLDSHIPTLFYLWKPHPLLKEYQFNRLALPEFDQDLFENDQ